MIEAEQRLASSVNQCVPQNAISSGRETLQSDGPAEVVPSNATLSEVGFPAIIEAISRAAPPLTAAMQVQLYKNWLAAGGGRGGEGFAAWYNMGVIYSQCGDKQSAILAYRQALLLKPSLNAAAVNLGLALEAIGSPEAALGTWAAATQPDAEQTALLNQQGRLLEQLGRLQEAEQKLSRSLRIDPAQPDAIQHWVHLRQKTCAWPLLDERVGLPRKDLIASCGPLAVLALTDDVDLQREVTADWISRKTFPCQERLAPDRPYRHKRIRVGYISSDFCRHAMSYLVAELFERHDRTRFEVYGYCSSREDGSDIRRRVLASFDQLRLIGHLGDEHAARLIRADEIDILIDLNGLTAGSRLQILRWKPAPFQATYLGFVGPLPLPELDALICDNFVVPLEQSGGYQPRPLAIDGIYQANESSRAVAEGLTREDVGLPPDRFVFCCFCGHFKVTEPVFAAWMTILIGAPDTVLCLADDNRWSRSALRAAAEQAGVDPGRLVFAQRCAPERYMAQLGLCDLFLDTFPYNAGTVASDAIRMKLPILTLPGRSFASRMAARLLDVYGATGGIATSLDDYIARGVSMATQPSLYAQHRGQFSDARWAASLGDCVRFTDSFERALLAATDPTLPRRP